MIERFYMLRRFLVLVLRPLHNYTWNSKSSSEATACLNVLTKNTLRLFQTEGSDRQLLGELWFFIIPASKTGYVAALEFLSSSLSLFRLALCYSLKHFWAEDAIFMCQKYAVDSAILDQDSDVLLYEAYRLWRLEETTWVQELKTALARFRTAEDSVLMTVVLKLAAIPQLIRGTPFVTFLMQLAFEMAQDLKLRALAIWLIKSIRQEDVDDLAAVPVRTWSEICKVLNAVKNVRGSETDYAPPRTERELFELCVTWDVDELNALIPGALSASIQLCTNGPFSQYIAFDAKSGLFRLGHTSLGIEDELPEGLAVAAAEPKRQQSLAAEFEQLKIRKQVLTSQASLHGPAMPSYQPMDLTTTLFVIDTNVFISNPLFLESFIDIKANIAVPAIVLEELAMLSDHPCKEKAAKAQQAVRWLDRCPSPFFCTLLTSGKLVSRLSSKYETNQLGGSVNDDLILKSCYNLLMSERKELPVVVSEDVNMRLKATAMGVKCIDIEAFFQGVYIR